MASSRRNGSGEGAPASSPSSPRKERRGLGYVRRVDTRDFWQDMAQQTTRKMAAWFEMNGHNPQGRRRLEGREWIKAIKYGVNQNGKVPDFYDLYKGPLSDVADEAACTAGLQDEEAADVKARHQRRAGSARRTEESLWLARHRGFARSAGQSVGRPQLRSAEVGHQLPRRAGERPEDGDVDAAFSGSADRARTLWVPLSEVAGGPCARLPDPEHSGAQLFRRGVAWEDRKAGGGRHKASPAAEARVAGHALGLWKSMANS